MGDNQYGTGLDFCIVWPLRQDIEYTIVQHWVRFPQKPFLGDRKYLRCSLVKVSITGSEDRLVVPCRVCAGVEEVRSSYATHRRRLKELLLSHYPTIPDVCVRGVMCAFLASVEDASATYNCNIHFTDAQAQSAHQVEIEFRPLLTQKLLNMLTGVALPDGMRRIEEECPVCMEAMETESMTLLTMPCSHTFHQPCLARWLNNARSCPLCRHRLHLPPHPGPIEEEEETDYYEEEETNYYDYEHEETNDGGDFGGDMS